MQQESPAGGSSATRPKSPWWSTWGPIMVGAVAAKLFGLLAAAAALAVFYVARRRRGTPVATVLGCLTVAVVVIFVSTVVRPRLPDLSPRAGAAVGAAAGGALTPGVREAAEALEAPAGAAQQQGAPGLKPFHGKLDGE